MCNKIFFVTLIALSVLTTGCGSTQTSQSTTGTPSSNQASTVELTKQDSSATGTTIQQSKEVFFGQWVVTKVVAYDRVGRWGSDNVKFLLGSKVSFSMGKATCFDDTKRHLNEVFINPIYKKTVLSKEEFSHHTKNVTFAKIGITSDSAQQIEVSNSNASNMKGCHFYIKDDDTLILDEGGAYFELKRDE